MLKPFQNIFNLFFPELCLICENSLIKSNQILCVTCRSNLPVTNFSNWKNNEVEKSFYGRVEIEAATSLLYFIRKGNVQQLIHQLKYKNQQEIGVFLGDWLGDEMLLSKRFDQLDCILMVPLHKNKIKKRGYNQVTKFGEALSKKLEIPLLKDVLISTSKSKTQTFKNRFERSKKLEEDFQLVNKEILKRKHILLLDDIITTGATLEACCIQLLRADKVKISIATMAYTL